MSGPGIFPPDFDALDRVIRQRTIMRLAWQYGDERAEQIAADQDPLTNLDIARWNALGVRRERA